MQVDLSFVYTGKDEKILLINNDYDTMDLLEQWLHMKGYDVKYTGNHESVPGILKEFAPDLLLVDAPQRIIAEKLKQQAADLSIPVLMMTGYSLASHLAPLPGNDVIEKPFNLALLEEKIQLLMDRHDGQQRVV